MNSIFNIENDFIDSLFLNHDQNEPVSTEVKRGAPPAEPDESLRSSLLNELIQRIERSMESMRHFTKMSRGKFSDKTFDEHFHQVIHGEIEKVDLLLSSVRNYLKVNTKQIKTGTVHTLIESVTKRNKTHLEKKKIRVFKKFDENLPETAIPDEHLKYILDSTLKYALGWMPLNGGLAFITRQTINRKEPAETAPFSMGEGKSAEVSVIFDCYRKKSEPSMIQTPPMTTHKQETLDFELQLIDDMIKKHRGAMEFKVDYSKGKTLITLRFPTERRKIVYYSAVN